MTGIQANKIRYEVVYDTAPALDNSTGEKNQRILIGETPRFVVSLQRPPLSSLLAGCWVKMKDEEKQNVWVNKESVMKRLVGEDYKEHICGELYEVGAVRKRDVERAFRSKSLTSLLMLVLDHNENVAKFSPETL
jgi:hypothetical protein